MNDSASSIRMLRHLLWKDTKTLSSLVFACVVAIVLINFIGLVSILSLGQRRDLLGIGGGVWFGVPFIFALGSGAMAVGTEQESGTLDWLRSLPVRWHQVVTSKFISALTMTVVVWACASLIAGLMFLLSGVSLPNEFRQGNDKAFQAVATVVGIYFYYSALAIGVSHGCCWLIRSPVAALILAFPGFLFAHFAIVLATETLGELFGLRYLLRTSPVESSEAKLLVVCGAMIISVVFAFMYALAYRRLTGMRDGKFGWGTLNRRPAIDSLAAYQPPIRLSNRKPSTTNALLWQQARQTRGIGFACLGLALLGILYLSLYSESWQQRGPNSTAFWLPLAFFSVVFAASCLGAMTFYGDSARNRKAFFADRGISVTRVWWTRLVVSLAYLFPLLAIAVFAAWMRSDDPSWSGVALIQIPAYLLGAWTLGTLTSMISKRPVLAYWGNLLVIVVSQLVLTLFFATYSVYFLYAILGIPIILFATWRLSQRWIENRLDVGFQMRAIGYWGLALAVPMLVVLSIRFATLPEVDQDWRARQTAYLQAHNDRPKLDSDEADAWNHGILRSAFSGPLKPFSFVPEASKFEAKLDKELGSEDALGYHVSLHELRTWIHNRTIPKLAAELPLEQRDLKAIQVALHWARRSREWIVEGKEDVETLIRVSEPAEQLGFTAISQITGSSTSVTPDERQELIQLMPDRELRNQSRRIAILNEWQSFQQQEWVRRFSSGKDFAGTQFLGRTTSWLPIEQEHSQRNLDQAIRTLLNELEQPIPWLTPESGSHFMQAWLRAVYGPAYRSDVGTATKTHSFPTIMLTLGDYETGFQRWSANSSR